MDIQISGGFGFGAASIHIAHRYFHGRDKVRLMNLDLDLVLQYPSKPASLSSLLWETLLTINKVTEATNVFVAEYTKAVVY
jgi:hypothetical protein